MPGTEDITALLLAWHGGEVTAGHRLVEAVYDELRRVARRQLARERANHSLSPTALVNEAYLKLVDQRRVRWQNRAHFFAVSAQLMRRILVDHARAGATAKRGAALTLSLEGVDVGIPPVDAEILELDAALAKLGHVDARQSRLVELRYFAGLTVEETAAVLDVAPITVKRDWALARAWLFRELRRGRDEEQ
jgi:RNA polymerase sigma factor (TIGR02999 family)